MDSTLKSNLSVGMPLDLACYPRDSLCLEHVVRIDLDGPYFARLRAAWGERIQEAFAALPELDCLSLANTVGQERPVRMPTQGEGIFLGDTFKPD